MKTLKQQSHFKAVLLLVSLYSVVGAASAVAPKEAPTCDRKNTSELLLVRENCCTAMLPSSVKRLTTGQLGASTEKLKDEDHIYKVEVEVEFAPGEMAELAKGNTAGFMQKNAALLKEKSTKAADETCQLVNDPMKTVGTNSCVPDPSSKPRAARVSRPLEDESVACKISPETKLKYNVSLQPPSIKPLMTKGAEGNQVVKGVIYSYNFNCKDPDDSCAAPIENKPAIVSGMATPEVKKLQEQIQIMVQTGQMQLEIEETVTHRKIRMSAGVAQGAASVVTPNSGGAQ